MTEDKLYFTTETGIQLFTNDLTENANQYAKSLRLRNIRVFKAVGNGKKVWLVCKGSEPIYETLFYEQIGTRLDAIKMASRR